MPSNSESITVARRMTIDATSSITLVNKTIVFAGGATDLTTALRNQSTTTFFPVTRMEIVSVESSGNSVRVANADNNADGVTSAAVFDYSQLVGADFQPNEETATRGIKFSNPNTVLFTFTARVIASVPSETAGATSTGANGVTTQGSTANGTNTSGSGTNSTGTSLLGGVKLLKFTVNPLTKTVMVAPLR
ncbi:MAG: hypothetical protein LC731_05795 [Acidobacteria bacterium]|nr:hypothetical protein [Acidobacteriota bacterium]